MTAFETEVRKCFLLSRAQEKTAERTTTCLQAARGPGP